MAINSKGKLEITDLDFDTVKSNPISFKTDCFMLIDLVVNS